MSSSIVLCDVLWFGWVGLRADDNGLARLCIARNKHKTQTHLPPPTKYTCSLHNNPLNPPHQLLPLLLTATTDKPYNHALNQCRTRPGEPISISPQPTHPKQKHITNGYTTAYVKTLLS